MTIDTFRYYSEEQDKLEEARLHAAETLRVKALGPHHVDESPAGLRLINIEGKTTSDTKRADLKSKINFAQRVTSDLTFKLERKNDQPIDQLKDSFLDLRDLVLNLNGMGDELERIEDFTIDFNARTATFTNPAGDKKYIDLWDLKDNKAQEFCDKFFAKAAIIFHLNSNLIFSKASRGNHRGEKPYKRGDAPGFEALPKSFDECAGSNIPKALAIASLEDRKTIMQRLLFAEATCKKFPESIAALIDMKEKARREASQHMTTDTDARRAFNELGREIDQLKNAQAKWSDIDFYALSVMLTLYPTKPFFPERIDAILKVIETGLDNQLKYEPSWLARRRLSDEYIEERQRVIREYIQSVKLSFYKAMGRGIYIEKCKELGVRPEQEGVEDLIFRQALSHEKNANNVSNILLPALTESYNDKTREFVYMSSDLQKRFTQSIDAIDFAAIIPAPTDAELTVDNTLEQNTQFKLLGEAVQGIRGRLNWTAPERSISVPVLEESEESKRARLEDRKRALQADLKAAEEFEKAMLPKIVNAEEPTLTRMKNTAKTMIAEEVAGIKEVITAPFRWVWNHLPTPADIDDENVPLDV